MLTQDQIEILRKEILTDPLNRGYLKNDFSGIILLLNNIPMIPNPTSVTQISLYSVTDSVSPIINVTSFLNLIPVTEILAIKLDSNGIGLIFYERLHALEARGGNLDITHKSIIDGVNYCYNKGFISLTTKDKLTGTYLINDPNWKPEIPSPSRAQELGFSTPIDLTDIRKVLL